MKTEQKGDKRSARKGNVSNVDVKDMLTESFYRKRGRKTPLPEVLKKTKNRAKSGKAKAGKHADKEKPETEDPSQLQISSIDTIELNNILSDKEKVLLKKASNNKQQGRQVEEGKYSRKQPSHRGPKI